MPVAVPLGLVDELPPGSVEVDADSVHSDRVEYTRTQQVGRARDWAVYLDDSPADPANLSRADMRNVANRLRRIRGYESGDNLNFEEDAFMDMRESLVDGCLHRESVPYDAARHEVSRRDYQVSWISYIAKIRSRVEALRFGSQRANIVLMECAAHFELLERFETPRSRADGST